MSASIEVTRARAVPALRLLATGTILTTSAILATGAAVAPEAEAATRLATPYRCTTQPLLKNGSTGECPKAVQWTLNSFAHRTKQKDAPLALTGLYGPRTTTLVRALQRAYQLPATGVIDARTWPVVVKEAARASVTTATHLTSPSTPRPTATPASTVSRYTLTTTNVRSAAAPSSGRIRATRRFRAR